MKPSEIERTILSHPLPGNLPADQGWVMPHYQGLSVANLPATIAALLGQDLPGALPPLPRQVWADWVPGLRRVVCVTLDALGYRRLQSMWERGEGEAFAEVAQGGRLVPLTSIFPSTTAAALISMATGRPPAEHGWLAYTMVLREMGLVANAILFCPIWTRQVDLLVKWGLDPETILTAPTLASHLTTSDILTAAVLSIAFRRSAFTDLVYRGVSQVWEHRHASDLWVQLRHLLAETRGQRAVVTAYWSGLDTLGHAYGQDTDLWEAEFRTVGYLLGREFLGSLPAEDREGTLLLITADHGQIVVPKEHILTVNEDPGVSQHLLMPVAGESRAAFLYPRPGRADTLVAHLRDAYPDWFVIQDSAEALEAGLMGSPISDESYARAGELLVLPRGDRALQQAQPPFTSLGRHGGLTPEEMLVPLIGARLDALP